MIRIRPVYAKLMIFLVYFLPVDIGEFYTQYALQNSACN